MAIPVSRARLRDAARVGVQTATAVFLTFGAMWALRLPDTSWAVISALFVLHRNADATLSTAGGRILGTLVGSVIGLAGVWIAPDAGWLAVRLVVGAAIMNAIAALRPSLQYGVVATAIIALGGGDDPMASALQRGLAILLGALIAAGVALLVWREDAGVRARRSLAAALEACAALLDTALGRLAGGAGPAELADAHRRYLEHITAAESAVDSGRKSVSDVQHLRRAVHAVERIWHTIIILDRLIEEPQPPGARPLGAATPLKRVRACAIQRMDRLRACLSEDEEPGEAPPPLGPAVDRARTGLGSDERGFVLGFALAELSRVLDEADAVLRAQR